MIVPLLSGGNIDLNTLTTVIVRGLVETGRYLKIRTVLKDRPGALGDLLEIVSDHSANIYSIHHDRTSRDIEMSDTEVEIEDDRVHERLVRSTDEKAVGAAQTSTSTA